MLEQLKENWRASRIDGLIAIGGDDTLSVAAFLNKEGMNVISVPKTIDNDIGFTDYSFGFHTAVGVITDAIDRLRTTAEAHDRVIILEVMGRHSGLARHLCGNRRRRGPHPRARASLRHRGGGLCSQGALRTRAQLRQRGRGPRAQGPKG